MQSSFFEIWTDKMITKYRKNLIKVKDAIILALLVMLRELS